MLLVIYIYTSCLLFPEAVAEKKARVHTCKSNLLCLISSMSWVWRCFQASVRFSFFCLCVKRVTEHAHMHMWYLKVSQQQHSLLAVTHFPCSTSFSSLMDPRGAEKPAVYVHFISQQQSSEGEPGPLSQQRTTHHFLLSSLLLGLITESKHSGSMILVSQGRLLIQFSPQHCTVARSFSGESKEK